MIVFLVLSWFWCKDYRVESKIKENRSSMTEGLESELSFTLTGSDPCSVILSLYSTISVD